MSGSSSTSSSEVTTSQANTDRKGFLRHAVQKTALFLVLPVVYMALLLAADPFQFFNLPVTVSTEASRTGYAAVLNPSLYRLTRFRQDPMPDILLGDSRMALFKEPDIERLTGKKLFNLSIPGGTLEMTMDAFWYATEQTKLQSVQMAVSLDTYNDFKIGSEIDTVRSINQNPLLYFTNRNVFKASVEAYRQRLGMAASEELTLDQFTRDQVWQDGLQFLRSSFGQYEKPGRYLERLEEIAAYCQENDIDLEFVILPQHADAWGLIEEYGLQTEYEQMLAELGRLAPVVDLTDQTAGKDQYTDPIHFRGGYALELIPLLWGDETGAPVGVAPPSQSSAESN